MAVVVIQTGTRDELAGVTVGSGNVWARPGHAAVSVQLALPDDEEVTLSEGESTELGGRRCTLERIEPVEHLGVHRLHFRVDDSPGPSVAPSPASDRTPGGEAGGSRTMQVSLAGDGNPATGLRRATRALLEVLGADPGTGPEPQEWSRTEHEEWVEIDRVPCGPNTTTTWTWSAAPGSGTHDASPATRAEVREEVVRWNPDDVHDVRLWGSWHHDGSRLHVSLTGTGTERRLHVSGPEDLVERAADLVCDEVGLLAEL